MKWDYEFMIVQFCLSLLTFFMSSLWLVTQWIYKPPLCSNALCDAIGVCFSLLVFSMFCSDFYKNLTDQ